MTENTMKPQEQSGKGITEFNDSIKEEISKRKVVCCRLTKAEYKLFKEARGEDKTDSNFMRELIESNTK